MGAWNKCRAVCTEAGGMATRAAKGGCGDDEADAAAGAGCTATVSAGWATPYIDRAVERQEELC